MFNATGELKEARLRMDSFLLLVPRAVLSSEASLCLYST